MKSLHEILWSTGFALLACVCVAQPPRAELHASSEEVSLNISAQPIGDALNAFAKQAGVQIFFYSTIVEGVSAPRLVGSFTPKAALTRLLADTSLRFEFLNERTVAIRTTRPTEADATTKPTAYANQGVAALRLAQADAPKTPDPRTAKGGFWKRFLRLAQSSEDSPSSAEQSAQNPKEDSGQGGQLEEIVVTAERREESAQSVPISMSVFSGEFIKQYIGDQFELTNFTPNFQLASTGIASQALTTMRGLGNIDAGPASPHSIVTYYDGIAASSSQAATFPQWDLDRIEVQRGPQGTLYGRNAVGGLVHYHSAAPTDEFEGYGEVTAGEYYLRRFEGAVSGPINENVKARLSAVTYDRGGDLTNTFLHKKQREREYWGVRAIVDWEIADNFDARVKAQYFEGEEANMYFNAAPSNLMPADVVAWFTAIGEDLDLERESNFETIRSGHPNPSMSLDVTLAELDLNYDLGPVMLTAIGGFLYGDRVADVDANNVPVPMTQNIIPDDQKQWSGEVRLTSQTDYRLQWVAGAYYQHTEDSRIGGAEDNTGLLRDLDGDGLTRHNADSPEDLLDGLIPVFAGVSTIVSANRFFEQKLESHALFLHTTYSWTDRLKTTHAVRYTDDEVNVVQQATALYEIPLSFGVMSGTPAQRNDFERFAGLSPAQQRQLAASIISDPNVVDADGNIVPKRLAERWEEFTWRFAADYQVMDDVLTYASVSRGFKGGTFGTNFAVDPETSTTYEIGGKTQWFDNRLRVNASVFYNDLTNFQTTLLLFNPDGTFGSALANLPESEIYGGEIEIVSVPFDNLLIAANLGMLDSKITKVLPGNEAILGNKLPLTEDLNFSGLVRYDIPTPLGTFSPQLSGHYTGEYWSSKDNNDDISVGKPGGFWTADARLGYESPDGKMYGLFYVKNLFDEMRPVWNGLPSAVIGTSVSFITHDRRNWGVTVGYRF